VQRDRQTQADIPPTRLDRETLLRKARDFARENGLVPPIPLDELRKICEKLCDDQNIDRAFLNYAAVVLNNELWRETLATIPYNRRLLLLPKCLRVEEHCPAPFDEFGLLCKKCGMCSIQELQDEAEKLGYAVLVAEGSPIVMAIIETGKIDAIVGVSCLSVLERAFPYMEAAAIPGVAIPLLQDDCKDTTVDLDWVWDVIHLTSDDKSYRMDLAALKDDVQSWFSRESLAELLGQPESETENISLDWLARSGKRWRPFLTVAVHQALQDDPTRGVPEDLRRVALAIECFHKASLIHDDIEDDDQQRYGEQTLHEEYGVALALNIGDHLLGEGYRLLAECDASPEVRSTMLRAAAQGHRMLCIGQGEELSWARKPKALRSVEVLDIFARKTAPAFEVALQLGAMYAGCKPSVFDVIARYSRSLGLAYQIRDDIADLDVEDACNDIDALRPTLPLALAHERAKGDDKAFLKSTWTREIDFSTANRERIAQLIDELGVRERSRELLEAYKEEAIRSLRDLESANLKGLLRRVIGKIFNDTEIKGWCNEFETRNAAGREAGTQTPG
jgi:geranylgeranyl pyrophosphate synthase